VGFWVVARAGVLFRCLVLLLRLLPLVGVVVAFILLCLFIFLELGFCPFLLIRP